MTPEEAAVASADAVSNLTSRFMLDAATYIKGGELGFQGMSFYTAGRGGVLGDVDAQAVTEAFVFFHPDQVAANWESGGEVMARAEAAREFAECGNAWAESHLPDDLDAARLAELAKKIVDNASGEGAPVFAGWRELPAPSTPKAAACHYMNALRELRFALHGMAVQGQGIAPADALRVRSPHMLGLFGWGDAPESTVDVKPSWNTAEDQTNEGMAYVLSVLSETELDEFVALANAANTATQ